MTHIPKPNPDRNNADQNSAGNKPKNRTSRFAGAVAALAMGTAAAVSGIAGCQKTEREFYESMLEQDKHNIPKFEERYDASDVAKHTGIEWREIAKKLDSKTLKTLQDNIKYVSIINNGSELLFLVKYPEKWANYESAKKDLKAAGLTFPDVNDVQIFNILDSVENSGYWVDKNYDDDRGICIHRNDYTGRHEYGGFQRVGYDNKDVLNQEQRVVGVARISLQSLQE